MPNVQVVRAGVCSSCEVAAATALWTAREQLKCAGDVVLLLGRDAKPVSGKRNIVSGQCLNQYKDVGFWIPGCPPRSMGQALHDYTGRVEDVPVCL